LIDYETALLKKFDARATESRNTEIVWDLEVDVYFSLVIPCFRVSVACT